MSIAHGGIRYIWCMGARKHGVLLWAYAICSVLGYYGTIYGVIYYTCTQVCYVVCCVYYNVVLFIMMYKVQRGVWGATPWRLGTTELVKKKIRLKIHNPFFSNYPYIVKYTISLLTFLSIRAIVIYMEHKDIEKTTSPVSGALSMSDLTHAIDLLRDQPRIPRGTLEYYCTEARYAMLMANDGKLAKEWFPGIKIRKYGRIPIE